MKIEFEYCDHCGVEIFHKDRCAINSLPIDIGSANAGESAVLCSPCYKRVTKSILDEITNIGQEMESGENHQ